VYYTGYSCSRGGQLQDRASLEKLLLASGFTGRISESFASNSTIKVGHVLLVWQLGMCVMPANKLNVCAFPLLCCCKVPSW
jgi:hypothetical protein